MTVTAFVAVNRHWIVGWMTANTERCVKDMTEGCDTDR